MTKLNTFLGCPFAFFGSATLGLDRAPCAPQDRLDPRLMGSAAHEILNRLAQGEGTLDQLLDQSFEDHCSRSHIASGYHREALRLQLHDVLTRYLEAPYEKEQGSRTVTEYSVSLTLAGVELTGRIDRVDITAEGGVTVIDYKYSTSPPSKLLKELEAMRATQLPLYALAYCRTEGGTPEGLIYIALREERGGIAGIHSGRQGRGIESMGAGDLAALIAQSESVAREALGRILAGDIAVDPVATDICRYCEFRDACRIDAVGPQRAVAPSGGTVAPPGGTVAPPGGTVAGAGE